MIGELRVFGEYIKQLRDKENLTRSQAAAKLKISTTKLFLIEKGFVRAEKDTLDLMSKIYSVNINDLYWQLGEIPPSIDSLLNPESPLPKVKGKKRESKKEK